MANQEAKVRESSLVQGALQGRHSVSMLFSGHLRVPPHSQATSSECCTKCTRRMRVDAGCLQARFMSTWEIKDRLLLCQQRLGTLNLAALETAASQHNLQASLSTLRSKETHECCRALSGT